jgi:hypothetical protein
VTFSNQNWQDIHTFLSEMADEHPEFRHLASITASILASGVADQLAGQTSMHDLHVLPWPLQAGPVDPIVVYSPSSMERPPAGMVVIEHRASTSTADRIERPVAEAVPLFWRFVIEKFGVAPNVTE